MRKIIVEIYPWESRVAVVEEDQLAEIFWANEDEKVGNIYKGKIKDVLPGLSCAFIDIGLEKNAFLYFGDVFLPPQSKGLHVADLLKGDQDIMVQVRKEAFSEKGARVTGNISIPGHLLVLLPGQEDIAVSRKITSSMHRERLKSLMEEHLAPGLGVILRTACLNAEDQEIIQELQQLSRVWQDINKQYQNSSGKPQLLFEDMDVIERTLRDYMDGDTKEIIVNNSKLKKKIGDFLTGKGRKSLIELKHVRGDLLERYGLEKDFRRALKRRVWLKNGGYLIFDTTEAMTVIDVNSGKFTGKNNFEDTILKLNLEAAVEIPRQLRLRSIGGIILVDFVDMQHKENKEKVIRLFREELSKDKNHTRIMGLTSLGFLELTRKKNRYGITDFFTTECKYCQGRGRVVSTFALTSEIKRKLANMDYVENDIIVCETSASVYENLIAHQDDLSFIKNTCGKNIEFLVNDDLNAAEYKLYTR